MPIAILDISTGSNSCGELSAMTIYLYVKTHNKTGLKYLGKTTQDPYTYLGSGVDWKQHLKENGEYHTTQIIRICNSNKELNEWGRYYSILWNVVESKEWANRIPETGGGWCDEQARKKISKALTGLKRPPPTPEHRKKLSQSSKGKSKPRSKEHQRVLTESIKSNWANNLERKKQVSELGKANKGRKHTPEALEKKRQAMLEYWRIKKSQSL
jgi:hypothetical protein